LLEGWIHVDPRREEPPLRTQAPADVAAGRCGTLRTPRK
jgi:hypothetical protein